MPEIKVENFKKLEEMISKPCGWLDAKLFANAINDSQITIDSVSFDQEEKKIIIRGLTPDLINKLSANLALSQDKSITGRLISLTQSSDGVISIKVNIYKKINATDPIFLKINGSYKAFTQFEMFSEPSYNSFILPSMKKSTHDKDDIMKAPLRFSLLEKSTPTTIKKLPWHMIPGFYDKILQISQNILSKYPPENFRVMSLGQSPAWIIHGAKILSSPENSDKFGFIAFSLGFLRRSEKTELLHEETESLDEDTVESKVGYYSFDETMFNKAKEGIQNYRKYLSSINMGINDIISLWKKGIKTVIVEHMQSGKGLASFMHVLCEWAKEENKLEDLENSLHLLKLTQGLSNEIGILAVPGMTKFHLDRILVSEDRDLRQYKEMYLLVMLANSDKVNDRLVEHYPPSKWNGPPILEKNENVNIIKEELYKLTITNKTKLKLNS